MGKCSVPCRLVVDVFIVKNSVLVCWWGLSWKRIKFQSVVWFVIVNVSTRLWFFVVMEKELNIIFWVWVVIEKELNIIL